MEACGRLIHLQTTIFLNEKGRPKDRPSFSYLAAGSEAERTCDRRKRVGDRRQRSAVERTRYRRKRAVAAARQTATEKVGHRSERIGTAATRKRTGRNDVAEDTAISATEKIGHGAKRLQVGTERIGTYKIGNQAILPRYAEGRCAAQISTTEKIGYRCERIVATARQTAAEKVSHRGKRVVAAAGQATAEKIGHRRKRIVAATGKTAAKKIGYRRKRIIAAAPRNAGKAATGQVTKCTIITAAEQRDNRTIIAEKRTDGVLPQHVAQQAAILRHTECRNLSEDFIERQRGRQRIDYRRQTLRDRCRYLRGE
jgi:hypothetical protein